MASTRFFHWRTVILALIFVLSGCSTAAMMERLCTPAERATAISYLDLLRKKNYDPIEKAFDRKLASPALHDDLVQMNAAFPAGEPTAVKLVGVQRMSKAGESEILNLTFEFGFSGKWILSNVALQDQAGVRTIVGMSAVPQQGSVEEASKFSLTGKSPLQYLILTLAIIVPLFVLYALVVCIRTRLKGKKWPWIIFILLGVGQFAINWTTAELAFAPVAIQLFGASVVAPLGGAWTLAVSLPIGAIIFLARRRALAAPTAV